MFEYTEYRHAPETSVIELTKATPLPLEQLCRYGTNLDTLIDSSHSYDPAYDRWQTVRHIPEVPLTGFEGYFIGHHMDPNQIQQEISQMGKDLYRYLPGSKKLYWDILTGERFHMGGFLYLQDKLAALLAINRARVSKSPEAREFRNLLVEKCNAPVTYVHEERWKERQQIPKIAVHPLELEVPTNYPNFLDPSTGYGSMLLLGKIGHPSTRALLNNISFTDRRTYLSTVL